MLSKNDVGEKLKFEIEKLKSVVNFKENIEAKEIHGDTEPVQRNVKEEIPIEDIEPEEAGKGGNMFYKK